MTQRPFRPSFVLHEIVIPAKDILVVLHLRGALALALPLLAFLATMGFLYAKLERVYYSKAA